MGASVVWDSTAGLGRGWAVMCEVMVVALPRGQRAGSSPDATPRQASEYAGCVLRAGLMAIPGVSQVIPVALDAAKPVLADPIPAPTGGDDDPASANYQP